MKNFKTPKKRSLQQVIVIAAMTLLWGQGAFGNPKKDSAKSQKKVSKEISFDEILVQGKHHFSDEAVVTVEQDKVLDALLQVRKDFKDRIRKSAKRN